MSFGFLFVSLALALILAFEAIMFIDAVRNPRFTDTQRLLWCAGMLLAHPFVAIAYYVLEYQNSGR